MRRVNLRPGIYDRDNLDGGQVCKGQVMGSGEGEDVAFSRYGLGF